MKKLRMIITSAVVLVVVGSAFAFNAKKILASYCYSTTGTTTCANTLKTDQKAVTAEVLFTTIMLVGMVIQPIAMANPIVQLQYV